MNYRNQVKPSPVEDIGYRLHWINYAGYLRITSVYANDLYDVLDKRELHHKETLVAVYKTGNPEPIWVA